MHDTLEEICSTKVWAGEMALLECPCECHLNNTRLGEFYCLQSVLHHWKSESSKGLLCFLFLK